MTGLGPGSIPSAGAKIIPRHLLLFVDKIPDPENYSNYIFFLIAIEESKCAGKIVWKNPKRVSQVRNSNFDPASIRT